MFLNKKPKPLSRPQEVDDIRMKDDKVSSQIPIATIVMPIRIIFDNPINFNDHFSKPKDLKKDLAIAHDSTESSILPPPLLDSDSPFTTELSASFTLNSLGNEDKVFKPGILVYHTIHDKNLVTLEKNLRENISSGTLLFLKEPSSPRPPPEPPDVEKCLEPKAEECIQAFQTLKKKLTEAQILIAPNWDQPFELMCDASDYAIGAVIGQRIEKQFRLIHYAIKTMTEAETNYTTTEKEMLAVVYVFEKFRSYLIMNKSVVYTDHSALKYLFNKKDAKARLLLDGFTSTRFNFRCD
ncbi:reverse transcriptase domain-containing protein [Tanacetum coccineum]